ncbi:MAG: glycoside hydrolase family 9 protein [Phaeodactylibacter sp.]|nr:glycoside hydrolase family 9 protein [Phaeodactylibacter sp.]MCB9274139.1 glycoside hydrolase family 9 protein [Lewinellaceae bacterium]
MKKKPGLSLICVVLVCLMPSLSFGQPYQLNEQGYFEKQGADILVFNNWYNGLFSDSKISGVELIHHGVRTATNGDVRLHSTPEQWDAIPQFVERRVDTAGLAIEAHLRYPAYDFDYRVRAVAMGDEIRLSVLLDKPLPEGLRNRAGLNLEFLPSAYFEKTYLADGQPGLFPLYPSGPTLKKSDGSTAPLPIAGGKKFVLAPESAEHRVTIEALTGSLSLYDGRNKAQNGWFVLRTLLPSNVTGIAVEWSVKVNTLPGWVRPPVITYSQVGYHPAQKKAAVIELDKNDSPLPTARLLKLDEGGGVAETLVGAASPWGRYTRYNYLTFDFSVVVEEGLYVIEYGGRRSAPFPIGRNVYEKAWQPTLGLFMPIQMDHMAVNEAYRVWHGASHLDDALQAPVNHEHFDLYAQGPTADTPYQPGEHIPGLNIGGWYDAGDYDIRTQTQYAVVLNLVQAWERFHIDSDETTIDQKHRWVDLHHPDGSPDLLQQIEHGTLALIAQHRAVGHAIAGIIAAQLHSYHHLGDGSTKTDNRVYNPQLDSLETDGYTSGTFDDRWAFTSRSSALNYGSIAALAAASRALRGFNDELADECLATAERAWDEEQGQAPNLFRHGNTTGGQLEDEELKATVELLATTKNDKYLRHFNGLWSTVVSRFAQNAMLLTRVLPFLDEEKTREAEKLALAYKERIGLLEKENPYGVPISTGGWAGSGQVIGFAQTNYYLHRAFPGIISKEDVYKGLHYVLGCHPGSGISFVSGVGLSSKKVAYGMNRADFSFIAGGIVPGVLILQPGFPENKEDWPFLWGENEYVISLGPSYIFLVHAVRALLKEEER